MSSVEALLRALSEQSVEFIIVGGVAAAVHGSARVTYDLDVVYRRNTENLARLAACLSCHQPYLRGAPPGLPFRLDVDTLRQGLNFTLTTNLGEVDLLDEIAGGGSYEDLLPDSVELRVFGVTCLCLGLEKLMHVKRAAGRRKDLEAVAEMEALLEERRKTKRR